YHLKGIVYFGEYHFTSCLISKDGEIWFNDGMTTGRECLKEGNMKDTELNTLLSCNGKTASLAIYAQ
ncbi:hypothetical protein OE88DRAFT_1597776, partial [Heliocybe sulcata]